MPKCVSCLQNIDGLLLETASGHFVATHQ